ncbi:Uncharacterised protein [Burkholderia pseudomallei]|uniref:Uncharacterized protein n=2 Tax=Burkholderia pseudomallei TaxID=28450 RepID=A0A0H3HJ90_BURP2|nr:hypothetical protein BP1026B_I1332 [Burkholderia pseudomallei 1026b]AIP12726.1 hypothetical protein DP60_2774 [Burkholderia pseudomallei]EDO92535.1 hypothetical protein BURPSPAST_AA1049 [Burkholderia pseudomallei Pasteur 52237]EET08754.1 hypothetical protein BURPS1710A_2869 [Burkholderia pseudomallei 1710a]EIF66566.1 hypothetical protein BP1026A_0611 [Burkholderia pseudomallei 1026a]EIF77267.1 hypothetical protein BP354E_0908 [Burkholderia pseudomallei 354e]EIF81621.1 hypothetical protein 
MLARAVRAGDGREGSLPDGRRARDTAARMAGIARSLAAGGVRRCCGAAPSELAVRRK